MMLQPPHNSPEGFRPRHLLVLAVLLAGLLATWGMFEQDRRTGRRLLEAQIQAEARERIDLLERALNRTMDQIGTLADFVRVEERVDRSNYERFATGILRRHPTLYSFVWSEWITHDERDDMVAELRADGYDVSDVTERHPPAPPIISPPRPVYLVARLFAPRDLAEAVVGFNVLSTPERREAVEQARDSGQPVATPPLVLGADRAAMPGMIIFVPIYDGWETPATVEERRERFRGTASIGFRIPPLMERVLNVDPPRFDGAVFDASRPDRPLLYHRLSSTGNDLDYAKAIQRPWASEYPITVANRRWIVVLAPTQTLIAALRPAHSPQLILFIGLVATLAMAGIVWSLFRRADAQTALAAERQRTSEEMRHRMEEKEAARRALAHANDELNALNQEMEQLVSAVSHDLKNPIVGIEWMTTSLERALDEGKIDAARTATGHIREGVGSMKRLIGDLLAHSRAGFASFEPRLVSLAEVVDSVLRERSGEIDRLRATIRVADNLPTVRGDHGRLLAAIDNLIGNALRYGRHDGAPPRVEVGVRHEGDAVAFFVKDHGPGVPPGQEDAIFKLFHRAANDEDGTGIGLAIVARVARAHGGRAWVESEAGRGATFWISLPACDQPSAPGGPATADGRAQAATRDTSIADAFG